MITYDRADRILSAGSTSITVDPNGNLTARGADAFAYDQANRLISAAVAGTTETYVYDTSAGLATLLDDGTRKYVSASASPTPRAVPTSRPTTPIASGRCAP